jgi:two-component system NtrC family response regulator
LREREGDLTLLAQYFLNLFNRELSRSLRGFSEEALAALTDYKWPGNVRELENRLKRAAIMADGPLITSQDLQLTSGAKPRDLNLRDQLRRVESAVLKEALAAAGGNLSRAAKMMGISRQQIYNMMAEQKQRA